MKRLDNWPALLAKYFQQKKNEPFVWGKNDCCRFADGAVIAITGQSMMKSFNYTSEKEALRLLKTSLEALTSAELGQSIKPAFAQRGDVVLVKRGELPALAICDGAVWHGAGQNGIESGVMSEAICCWKVGK
jgi:hypothetical protein